MNAALAASLDLLPRCLRVFAAIVLAGVAPISQCAAQTPADGIGGGWLHGGAVGEYFANADLNVQPSFTRRDVRVDFDWGTLRGPGGSHTPKLAAVGADGFSVRWTGQVRARFAERYAFTVVCDDGALLFIKPVASGTWTPLVDQWGTPGTHTGSFALEPEQTYDVLLEYREVTGAAVCTLRWSSPSTPEEVLDSATLAALNLYSYGETDELGFSIVGSKLHVHDLQATILHLLGFNYEKLTYCFQGRDFRLTDVHGKIVKGILA